MGYIAHYGYTDGSGDWYIRVDSGRCDGCGDCVPACPVGVLEMMLDDYDDTVLTVSEEHRKNLKFSCAPCKPVDSPPPLPCVLACPHDAIVHSW